MSAIEPTVHRHRIGTCPACRSGLWADVTVEVSVSPPVLDAEGRARAGAHARVVAMRFSHECDEREPETEVVS